MAEKILQTRIINKHAELETWKLSTLPLKEGEIALAKVMVAQPDGTQAPTYVAKIGLEGKTFAECPMLFAPSSDVHSWAKTASKPTYNASEIKLTTEGSTSVQEEIIALKAAVGNTEAVESMITAAIEALDVEDSAVANQFVTAVAEADGKITVSRRALEAADIPALGIDKITGLQNALNLKANSADVKQTTDAISARLDSGDIKEAIVDAQEAADAAQKTIDDYKTANDARVKSIEDDYTTAAQAGTIAEGKVDAFNTSIINPLAQRVTNAEADITSLAGDDRTTETVKGNADAIAKLAQDIGNVANVMNFRGVSVKGDGTVPGHDITDPKAGDVIIYGEAEYVYDESGEWVKFGDASDNATAISDLQTRVGNVENDLKAGGATYQSIVAAQTQADKGVEDAKTANDAIAVINGTGDGSIAKAVSAEAKLRSDADTAINDKIGGSFDSTNTVAKAITAAAEAASAAQTDIDTHKSAENAHTKAQVGLGNVDNKSVAEIKTEFTGSVAENNEGFVTGSAVYSAVEAAKTAAATTAQEKVDALANGTVKTNTQNIANNAADITTIKDTYVRVSGNQLVYGQDESEFVIVFDCGGAE